jgi:hypothetical protein
MRDLKLKLRNKIESTKGLGTNNKYNVYNIRTTSFYVLTIESTVEIEEGVGKEESDNFIHYVRLYKACPYTFSIDYLIMMFVSYSSGSPPIRLKSSA